METMVSAGKSVAVENGDGDCNVIVIDDDDDDPPETPSVPLNKRNAAAKSSKAGPSSGGTRPASSSNLGNPKRGGGQFRSVKLSSVPFRFEQTPGSEQKTTWKPISFILPRQPHTTGLAPQGMDLDKVRALDQSEFMQKSVGMMPLIVKPLQSSQPNLTSSVQGSQAPSPPTTAPAGQTSGAVSQMGSESIVLVFPCKPPQSTDSPQPAKAQTKMQSLLQKSPLLSQEAAGNIKSLKEVYFIQEGQKLSQLKKVHLETKSDTLPTQTSAKQRDSTKVEIKSPLESQLISKEAAKPINGSSSDSQLGGNTKLTHPNVKIVTISKDGIVQPNISRVVVSNQSILSQLMSGKKEIRAIGHAKTGHSIQPLTSSATVPSPPVVQKSSNFIPILPLPSGTLVNSASNPAAGQPLLTSTAAMTAPGQLLLASSNPSTIKPSHLPATLQEGLANLAKEAIKSGKKHILFVPKNTNMSAMRMSLLHNGTLPTQTKATPPAQSKVTTPAQSKVTTPAQSKVTTPAQSKVTTPAQSSKNILPSNMFDKDGLSVTGKETVKKSLLSNNNRSGVKDNNRNGQPENKNEHIFFTTLRTGNGQIAVKVVQPNLYDEKDPEWLPARSPKKTILIKGISDEESSEHPFKNTSNLPPANDAGLVDYQSRIKKASKLEKIVENILRSHKTDENVSLKKADDAEPLICAGSDTVENSVPIACETITKPVATENTSIIPQDKQDLCDQNDLDLKITSVYSLNPDSSFPNEPDDMDLSEKSFTCKIGDSPSWNKVVTPCFTVVERLPRCKSDPNEACRTMSHCSEHCRNRTLDYLCNLNLLKCECVHDQPDGIHSLEEGQQPSCIEKNVVPKDESSLDGQSTETEIAEPSEPSVEDHQITKVEEKRKLKHTKASLQISQDDQHANSLTIQTSGDSKPESTQTEVKCTSKLMEPVINVSSLVHSVTSSPNLKPNLQEDASLDAQNVQSSPQTQSSIDKCLRKISPPKVIKVATGKHVVSLLNTSLLSPSIVNRAAQEVVSSPEGSAFKKSMNPKEFSKLLAELKVQVERKRKEMKILHQIKKKIKSLPERNTKETAKAKSSELTKKEEMKVAFPFMAKKSAVLPDSSKSERRTKPGINLLTKQIKTSITKLTFPEKLKHVASALSSPEQQPDIQSLTSTAGATLKPISPERITEAISSLTKYLLTTGTKVTSDNNKYFLLKVDEQHVLVKIPQNFPMNKNLIAMSTLPSTAPKHVPIKPKPDAHSLDSMLQRHMVNPSLAVKSILPQSQRSATLMARVNKTRSDDQNGSGSAMPALVKSDANIPTTSKVNIDLAHLPLNSSLLPQRKKRNSKLTDEERKTKRAKLEAKYPLPPGVIIKCEPDDPMDYPIDDNWTVTSEFLTASESPGCGQSDNLSSVEERDEPPMLMSVSPVSPEAVADMQDEAAEETPPLLQPMLPAPSCHGSESAENDFEKEAETSRQVLEVTSRTSLSSCESGYASDSKKSREMPNPTYPKSTYKNSKIERLRELLKKKEMEIEEIRRMRNSLSRTEPS